MPFTLRPSAGLDVIFGNGAAGLLAIDLYNESGSSIVLSRNLLGQSHLFLTGAASIAGTAGSDTLIANDSAGSPDILFWDRSTVAQIVEPFDFISPFSNDAATSIDVILMGAGNDILTLAHDAAQPGNPGAYTLAMTGYGGDGNDIVWLAAGNDVAMGDAGDDLLAGQGGDDVMQGGAGFDTLFGGSGADLLRFDASDFVQGGGDTYRVAVWTGAGANPSFTLTLAGGSGYDWSKDIFDGGSGIDTLRLTGGNDLLLMNQQDLRINGVAQTGNGNQIANVEVIDGQAGNDVIVLNNSAGGNVVSAAFSIAGGAGLDLIVSGSGDDLIAGGNFVGAMAGGDRDTVYGGGGSDTIYGDSPDHPVDNPGGGIDTLYGGAGNDTTYGGAATDTLYGEDNRDTLYGGSGDDTAYGGNHGDVMSGDTGDDTLYGGDLDDSLDGGQGLDELNGGAGNDLLLFGADYDADGQLVAGWDGTSQNPYIVEIVFDPATVATFDSFIGGDATDTIDLRGAGSPGSRVYFGPAAGVSMASFLSGVELVHAGAAADVIILSNYQWEFDEYDAYASDVTVVAGEGSDAVFSGLGSDVVYGDLQAGTLSLADGADTLFGGAGNDIVYGDSVDGQVPGAKAGADTIYGGDGLDTIFGGGNDDVIFDVWDGSLYGGNGADLLAVELRGVFATGLAFAGDESENDGADRVFVSGYYETTTAELGAGDDVFIAYAFGDNGEGESGRRIDVVSGGTGGDLISTWEGDDTLDGGGGADVIWGGAGVDTITGGPDSDYLYGGQGDGDLLIGGDGGDFYYWARNDGSDRIEDQDPGGVAQDNYILVFAGFSDGGNDENGDAFIDGAGVFEVDGNLYDNDGDDMVQITVDPDDSSRLVLTVLQGEGAGSTLNFDLDEITMIGLSNSDTGQVAAYQWVDIVGHPQGGEYQLLA